MKESKSFKHMFFYWSLSMVVVTLPFPKYSLNSQSIILLVVSWLLFNNFSEKTKNLKAMLLPFITMSSIFWLSLLGLFYTDNFGKASEVLLANLPFLIIPLVFFSVKLDNALKQKLFKIFSFSVIIASVFGLIKALFFRINNLGNYFYYTEFSKILDIHTTYFALFLVLAILYFFYDFTLFKTLKKWQNVVCVIFLLGMLYIVSARISIIALVTIFIVYILSNFKKIDVVSKVSILIVTLLLTVLFFTSPNFQNRNIQADEFGTELPSIDTRLIHWEAVVNAIKKSNPLFGNGTGDAHENLFEEYRNLGFVSGYQYQYNAHNQYLEILLSFGLLGLFSLLLILYQCLRQSLKNHNMFFLTQVIVFMVFMLTESILERQKGIISFMFFLSLSLSANNTTSK
ncbi:O-antigen ligase [Bizionia echini]|uniref:O-antigen ligase n=1 Tax=Bizionia echini TaxID=649333 RepID=A0A1I4Z8F6_9FLAO|nr:O-antigen ligase family protein [Bizionia echini]SFN46574.1 O-antigen ligase [Bizionia echini]